MLSSLRDRVKNAHLSSVELFLILILLLFGVPMIVLVPPGAGYDEAGSCKDPKDAWQLDTVAEQVVEFAQMKAQSR